MKSAFNGILAMVGIGLTSCASVPRASAPHSCLTKQVMQFESLMLLAADPNGVGNFAVSVRQHDGTIAFVFDPDPDGQSVGGGGAATFDCQSGRLISQEAYR